MMTLLSDPAACFSKRDTCLRGPFFEGIELYQRFSKGDDVEGLMWPIWKSPGCAFNSLFPSILDGFLQKTAMA